MRQTCRGDTTLLLGIDADDPALEEYPLGSDSEVLTVEAEVIRTGARQVVALLNHLVVPRAGQYRYVMHVGDDNLFETVGWDERVIEALQRVPFCYGDDEYPGRPTGSLCCHIAMRSEVVLALGYMGPPSIRHMYVDPTWMAWGQATAIEFLADVKIPHLHYSAGKSEFDATYQASLEQTQHDLDAFNTYCATQLNADIAKLHGAPFPPRVLADFKRDLNIPG